MRSRHLRAHSSAGLVAGPRSSGRTKLWQWLACAPLLASPAAVQAAPVALKVTGDARLRVEEDWNSHLAAGARRPDRGRSRIRGRLMAAATLPDGFSLQARVRTAAANSQQNANVTFLDVNGNRTDTLKLSMDRFAATWRRGGVTVDVGRMAFPFFTTNEYMWDADISPLGLAAGVQLPLAGRATLKVAGGAFALPVGVSHYAGHLYAAQAVLALPHATVAGGLFRFEADRDDRRRLLFLDGNGDRDYSVVAVNTQVKVDAAGRPLALTADLYRNVQAYGRSPDPISRAFRHERTGYVLGAAWGDIAKVRHLQLGYRHFRMEKFATNSSFAHDDGARFGTAAQADLTDVRGNDVYANYALTRQVTAGVRAILSHRITNAEDDRRARFDVTYAF